MLVSHGIKEITMARIDYGLQDTEMGLRYYTYYMIPMRRIVIWLIIMIWFCFTGKPWLVTLVNLTLLLSHYRS
jgi:hypothetical protein